MDLYAQELKVWKECVGLRTTTEHDSENGEEPGREGEDLERCKVPGAFEW
jgi:hypothetical protein